MLDPRLAPAGPDHGHDVEADLAGPVRGGAQVGPGEPAELGLLGGVDGGRRGPVAVAAPGLDLAEHQQPGRLGDHVDLARPAAPVAGHDPQPGRGQPGTGERFAAPPQFAAIGGVLGGHGRTLAAANPELDDSAENVENPGSAAPARVDARVDRVCWSSPAPVRWRPPRRIGPAARRTEAGHARPVENTGALSSRRDMFLDERGAGLRVTWHPERDLVVLSVWQGDSCVGTFRMLVQDVPRLSGLLAAALGDWLGESSPALAPPSGHGEPALDPGAEVGRGPGAGGVRLSVQQRLRLSRPVLKLRGFQHRRRGST